MKHFYTMFLVIGLSCSAFAQQGKPIQENPTSFIKIDQSSAKLSHQALLTEKLKMTSNESMVSLKKETDKLGMTHEKYQHYYKGLVVDGSTYTVHSKGGVPTHMTGNYRTIDEVETTPALSNSKALESAKVASGAKAFDWEKGEAYKVREPEGELVIVLNTANGFKERLAYKFHILGSDPYVNAYVYVDAKTGEIVRYNSLVKHAGGHAKPGFNASEYAAAFADAVGSGATRYSGTQPIHTDSYSGSYRLRDYSRGSGVLTWDATTSTTYNSTTGAPNGASEYTDADNNWTAAEYDNATKDNAGLDAHFAAGATYDFFFTNFGRNSYDGNGAAINGYVNTDIEDVYNYPAGYNDNAFWTGYVMVYGKGNSLDPLTTVDITGHEIGHAYCTGTADLVYEKESGAMNESLSDIWGACVEYYTNTNYGTTKDLWNLGTEIGQTFRSMSNPKGYGDPDTYGGTYWVSQSCTPTSSNDYCGVHTNSGVGNHWFYMLAVGESSTNDVGDVYTVTGVGVMDAAAIAWRTESLYLTTTSNYANFRTYSIQSAVELFGAGSAQEIATTNAWYAVNVGEAYVQTCALAAPAALAASSVGDTGFTLSWNAVSGAASYTVTVGGNSTTITATTYNATGLASGTQYACSVVANCSAGGSGASANINVTTTGTLPLNYCASNGNNTADEYIGRVQFGSINNATGASAGGYGNHTNLSAAVTKGSGYTLTITPTWTGTVYNEGYAVWIDYNKDGDFVDSGEQVFSKAASKTTPVSGSVTIPTTAASGTTRMRVSMKYNAIPTSCESFSYGEVEDYTVSISGAVADTQAPTAPGTPTASNITASGFDVSWAASTDNVGVTGYSVYLGGSLAGTTTGTSYSFSSLSAATTYSVGVEAYDAAGNVSARTTANVTTSTGGGSTSDVLVESYFETGMDGWADGGADVYRYSGTNSYEGNYSIRIRDNSGTASAMTYSGVNLTPYSFVDIQFYFYAYSMETGEDFWVRFYNGSTWQTVATYAQGTSFSNNGFYTATVTLDAASYTFSSNSGFSFQCDASADADQIYIDQVTITGRTGAAFNHTGLASLVGETPRSLEEVQSEELDQIELYPNPVKDILTMKYVPAQAHVNVISMTGQVVRTSQGKDQLDLSGIKPGLYVVKIVLDGESKFIKIFKEE